jgi:hypothetical protein
MRTKHKSKSVLVDEACDNEQNSLQRLVCRRGRGNLMTVAIGLLLVLAGRFFILSLAGQIPQMQPGVVVHRAMEQQAAQESDGQMEALDDQLVIKPFDLIEAGNHTVIQMSDVTATDDYWNLEWWTSYLLKQMSEGDSKFSLSDERTYKIYNEDGNMPKTGVRTQLALNEWLISEIQVENQGFERGWVVRSVWDPQRGLTGLRIDAPQYLNTELKADQVIYDQAAKAARIYINKLNVWLKRVTNTDSQAPVAVLDVWPLSPADYQMQGMICNVIYEDPSSGDRFVIFYNVAIMQVTGFAAQ